MSLKGELLKAVYTALTDKVEDDYTYAPSGATNPIPVYSGQIPTNDQGAYIYIYTLASTEVGDADDYLFDMAISIKTVITNAQGVISTADVHAFADAASQALQQEKVGTISVTGGNIVFMQPIATNYNEFTLPDGRLEASITQDWSIVIESD